MKKLILATIAILCILVLSISYTYSRYQKNLIGNTYILNSQSYTDVTGSLTLVSRDDKTYSLTINNNNPYDVRVKIAGEVDGTFPNGEDYIVVGANSSSTQNVVLKGADSAMYTDIDSERVGWDTYLYVSRNVYLDAVKPYDAENVDLGATNIYLDGTLKETILSENVVGDFPENQVFNGPTTGNTGGLYTVTDSETGEKTYFYRGRVTDNYVSFAGYTWRILRINSDGSVRLILDGSAGNAQYKNTNVPTPHTIEAANSLIAWQNSTVYSTLHTWYNNNLAQYDDYIATSNYVFDDSYEQRTSSATQGSVYYYGSYIRVGLDGRQYIPTFDGTEENTIQDKIGLITADEISYAGGAWGQNNTRFFLYNGNIRTDSWTMSPSFWDNSVHYKAGILVMGRSGNIHDWPSNGNTLTSSLALRPVISLKADVKITGSGTQRDPYRVVTN